MEWDLSGSGADGQRIRFQCWVDEWVRHLDEDLNRPFNTVHRTYKPRVAKWVGWAASNEVDLVDPAPGDVFAYARRGRGLGCGTPAPSTIKNDILALKSFYRWLHNWGHLPVNPLAKVSTPKVPKHQPKPVPDGEWWELWARSLKDRTRLWVGWLYWCGLRRQEAADLRPSDVYGGTVEVRRKGGEVVQLPWVDLGELITRLQVDRGFPQAIEAFAHWQSLNRQAVIDAESQGRRYLLDYSPLPSGLLNGNYLNKELWWAGEFSITPHRLRHAFITNMARLGATIEEIAELCGHASLETTRGYLDARGNLTERLLSSNRLTTSQAGGTNGL